MAVRFSQMCWSRSDLIKNAERYVRIDLDLSDFEKEHNHCVMRNNNYRSKCKPLLGVFLFLMFRLEVWPGFSSSILQFETSSMLIIDVSHKVLHFQTVLDVMYDVYNSCRGAPNFKELAAKKIIGQIVLTRSVFHGS